MKAIMHPMPVQLRKPTDLSREKPQVSVTWGFSRERFFEESVVTP
jgi:hypothetical protein